MGCWENEDEDEYEDDDFDGVNPVMSLRESGSRKGGIVG